MTKGKTAPLSRLTHFFTYHPWLKIIALALAVIIWFYIRDEIGRFNY